MHDVLSGTAILVDYVKVRYRAQNIDPRYHTGPPATQGLADEFTFDRRNRSKAARHGLIRRRDLNQREAERSATWIRAAIRVYQSLLRQAVEADVPNQRAKPMVFDSDGLQ